MVKEAEDEEEEPLADAILPCDLADLMDDRTATQREILGLFAQGFMPNAVFRLPFMCACPQIVRVSLDVPVFNFFCLDFKEKLVFELF